MTQPTVVFLGPDGGVRQGEKKRTSRRGQTVESLHVNLQLWADNAGMYFDWGPDQQAYHAHVETRPSIPMPAFLFGPEPASTPRQPTSGSAASG